MESINLKQFDIKKIRKDSVCVFIAPRRSGKSYLIKDILYQHRDIPAGIAISKTDKLTHYYDQFIPPVLVYDEYEPQLLDKLFARQKKALDEKWANPNCFVIFDDTLSSADTWKKDENVKEIFYNGRHYKILFLLTMQAPLGIGPGLRGNIDYTFIMGNFNNVNKKALYENYCGFFPTREIFDRVLTSCTEDYSCLVVDNTSISNNIEDQVFYYRAQAHEDFKLCSNAFWLKSKPKKETETGTSKSYTMKGKNAKKLTITKM